MRSKLVKALREKVALSNRAEALRSIVPQAQGKKGSAKNKQAQHQGQALSQEQAQQAPEAFGQDQAQPQQKGSEEAGPEGSS